MKRQRKPADSQPVIFYRPAWTVGIHTRAQPRTTAHRLLFRQYIWRLPQAPPADITTQLEATIAELKGGSK